MKKKYSIAIVCLSILLVISYFNWKYEVIAVNPFFGKEKSELKVMTWNVHCSEGTDYERQRGIAELVLKEGTDFVLLNEFCLDSCSVIDSLLSRFYPYRNDAGAKVKAGDVFYSKTQLVLA